MISRFVRALSQGITTFPVASFPPTAILPIRLESMTFVQNWKINQMIGVILFRLWFEPQYQMVAYSSPTWHCIRIIYSECGIFFQGSLLELGLNAGQLVGMLGDDQSVPIGSVVSISLFRTSLMNQLILDFARLKVCNQNMLQKYGYLSPMRMKHNEKKISSTAGTSWGLF